MNRIVTWLRKSFITLLVLASFCLGGLGLMYAYMELFLPSVNSLNEVKMQTPLRIMTSTGDLIQEYGDKRRIPISFDTIPEPLLHAVLDTEDQRFFNHSGVDILGLGRAAIQLITTGQKSQGGSTITMQVARNFFLTRKKSYYRKFREILLAIKIDNTFSKQKILELYFNKVFLGKHAYGFAAAAKIYYGKTLDRLTLSEYATLAGLPKAPSTLNPIANPKGAMERRNHVLSRMLDNQHITQAQYDIATQAPNTASYHGLTSTVYAPYVAELVGNYLAKTYGNDVYSLGLQVYTSIDSKQQLAANKAVKEALFAYDKRHGYRGAEDNFGLFTPEVLNDWQQKLAALPDVNHLTAAATTGIDDSGAQALLANGNIITIDWANMSWARPARKSGWPGASPKTPSDVLHIGDVIRIQKNSSGQWMLEQNPQVEGALVAMDPATGAITALVGGLDYQASAFNRATASNRQAGSGFKPFIYAAALEKNMTLATIINDAPVVIKDSGENVLWRPQNDTRKFYGPTRLRVGLIQSRNLVSIRVLQQIGLNYATKYAERFGFNASKLPHSLSLALGTASVSPLQMATGFSVFANGGYPMKPFVINRISDANAKVLYQSKIPTLCPDNNATAEDSSCTQRSISPQIAYLMTSALQSVITEGTGRGALALHRKDLAGKTGTTDDQHDAWFSGFNHDLVAVSWVGFDQPQSLHEYGSRAALPMWSAFMKSALKGKPNSSMPEPTDIVTVRIDPNTGKLVNPGQKPYLFEKFRRGHLPAYSNKTDNSKQASSSQGASLTDLY